VARVIGIGGVFFRSDTAEETKAWYVKHLGIPQDDTGYVAFQWMLSGSPRTHVTIWEPFGDISYFQPSTAPFMLNYIVDDLDGMREQLIAAGVDVDPKVDDSEYGRFGWATDPEGRRFELWQPPVPKTGETKPAE
jgi:catechol 2,3-dioxygenase-like lactoylglutathione lyase family enzyme